MPSLFSTPRTPSPPPLPKIAPMPDPLAESEAKKRALQARAAASGRQSTFMSQTQPNNPGARLGG